MRLNFPESTDLFQIARELHKVGWIISAKRNRDGSHDVLPRHDVPQAPQVPLTTSARDLEGLQL